MNNDDQSTPYQLQNYQDDFTVDEQAVDRATHEQSDDPSVDLGVPAEELKSELDGLATDELATGDNDIRGSVENTDHPEDQESL